MSKATQENIKMLLSLTGATHQQLADIAGVDRSAVSHWKSGKAEPRMGHLQRIAGHYGITTANLANPGGMKYVRKGRGGRLHDDAAARLKDIKRSIMAFDDNTPIDDVLGVAMAIRHLPSTEDTLTESELEMLDLFRSLNDDGRDMAISVVAAMVKSGTYSQ